MKGCDHKTGCDVWNIYGSNAVEWVLTVKQTLVLISQKEKNSTHRYRYCTKIYLRYMTLWLLAQHFRWKNWWKNCRINIHKQYTPHCLFSTQPFVKRWSCRVLFDRKKINIRYVEDLIISRLSVGYLKIDNCGGYNDIFYWQYLLAIISSICMVIW